MAAPGGPHDRSTDGVLWRTRGHARAPAGGSATVIICDYDEEG